MTRHVTKTFIYVMSNIPSHELVIGCFWLLITCNSHYISEKCQQCVRIFTVLIKTKLILHVYFPFFLRSKKMNQENPLGQGEV